MIRMMTLDAALEFLGNPKFAGDFDAYVEELKANFRKLIVQYHSDRANTPEQEQLGNNLIEAYSIVKDAISKGELQAAVKTATSRTSKVGEKWGEDLFAAVSTITDSLVKKIGSMKKFLTALEPGRRSVCFQGFRFEVTTAYTGRMCNKEMEKMWTIHNNTIVKVQELGQGELMRLVLKS